MSSDLGDDHRVVAIGQGMRVMDQAVPASASVLIDTAVLRHSKLEIVLIGGFGPDLLAPRAYKSWSNGDFAFCYYGHPREPNLYIRSDFRAKFNASPLNVELREKLGDEFIEDLTDQQLCMMILQIYR